MNKGYWGNGQMKENAEQTESIGLRLWNRGKKGAWSLVFSRMGVVVLLFLVQIFALFVIFRWFAQISPHLMGTAMLIDIVMIPVLLMSRLDPTAKITWLMVVLVMPVFGSLLYAYTQSNFGHRALKKRTAQLAEQNMERIQQDPAVQRALQMNNPGTAALARYMKRSGCHPVFTNTQVEYFPQGEDKWARLLSELEKAKKFIFLEYFIIEEGVMWGRMLEILARKAKEGVEIRVMYDGTCEFSRLPRDYPARLRALGIRCKAFAPLTPFLSTHYNYRDHRKILVIDGHTAFCGGVNLADEYINRIRKFGHWKDTAVMLRGDAVRSFTLMFLQMWNIEERRPVYDPYLDPPEKTVCAPGFVIPYGDCPLDEDKLGERVYIDILSRAQKYVYIMTPYLILDSELENALIYAAERGVDVRLILPGVPDKAAPYALAKTYYPALMRAGVRIYEYTPGFVHAKIFVSDDDTAVVGTINLDYRSLCHHFECAVYLYKTPCIADIRKDFMFTLSSCIRVDEEQMKNEPLTRRIMGPMLRIIAPLL